MYEDIEFTAEDGTVNKNDVTVFALSTCGFCKRGLQFLRDNQVKFKYVYVDKIPYERKQKLKDDLKEKFEKRVAFPYVVVNDEVALVGFLQKEWESNIL